jgi:hypothetical protein
MAYIKFLSKLSGSPPPKVIKNPVSTSVSVAQFSFYYLINLSSLPLMYSQILLLVLFLFSVGGHFNPRNTRHGSPDDEENERVGLDFNKTCSVIELFTGTLLVQISKYCIFILWPQNYASGLAVL